MRVAFEIVGGFGIGVASWLLGLGLPVPPRPLAASSTMGPAVPSSASSRPTAAPVAVSPGPLDERWDDDATLPRHAEPVASYILSARLDPATHDIDGVGTIVWKNASRVPQRELWLHLYLNAFKNERTVYMGTSGAGFRGGSRLSDWGSIAVRRLHARELEADLWPPPAAVAGAGVGEDETDVRVPLPREIAPGESLTLDVAFRSHLPSISLRTGHYGGFHMAAQWFPKLARLEPDGHWAHFPLSRFSEFYADFGSYDVTVDVPAGVVVGATGVRASLVEAGGRAVARYVQDDVHDFAFAAWDGFREKSARSEGGVELRCLFPAGYERAAEVELEAARFGLAHLGQAYGRYPYATLTIVHPPSGADEAGGMEYPTLITTGGPWYAPWTPVRFLEAVTLHELGHQWFYGLVATNENQSPFLDEGVTSYAEVEAMEALYPGTSVGEALGLRVGLPAAHRLGALSAAHNGSIAQPADRFATGSDYGALVYSRTATLLATLSRTYGPDRMRRALGRYARSQRFEHPGPESLLAAIGEGLGAEAEVAARAAIFEGGWVDYAVESIASNRAAAPAGVFGDPAHPSPAPAPTGESGFLGDVLVRRRGTLVLPVEVALTSADGTVTRVVWGAKQSWAHLPYAGTSALISAEIDPRPSILLDANLLDNAVGAEGVLAPRVLEIGAFVASALVHAVAP